MASDNSYATVSLSPFRSVNTLAISFIQVTRVLCVLAETIPYCDAASASSLAGDFREHMSKSEPTSAPKAGDTLANKLSPGGNAAFVNYMQQGRSRNATITRNLYRLANYKSWAEKIRHDWPSGDDS